MRSALFWDITWRIVVIPYRRFGTTFRAPETSVSDCHYTLRNIREERRFHLLRGGSLKLRVLPACTVCHVHGSSIVLASVCLAMRKTVVGFLGFHILLLIG
jgi:hypothetical protein